MAMNISEEGMAITARFFKALEFLVGSGRFRGIQTFTRKYSINRWNLLHVAECPDKAVLKPEYIAILVRDFGISADWVLTGSGSMLSNGTDQTDQKN